MSPFGNEPRFRHAREMVPSGIDALLDYGCFDASLLETLRGKAVRLFGVDRNTQALSRARERCPDMRFGDVRADSIEFPEAYFDAVTCLEVMEHVPSEKALIRELARVTKPGGTLVLSVPHKGLLTFLDTGNFKFRFPRLVKFYYHVLRHDKETYRRRFVERENGMYGDVSVSKRMWHMHYTTAEIREIVTPYYEIEETVRYGLFTPVIDILKLAFCLVLRLEGLLPLFDRLDAWDKSLDYGRASYIVIMRCKRTTFAT